MDEPSEKRLASMNMFELADVIRDVSAPLSLRYLALEYYCAKLKWPDQSRNPELLMNGSMPGNWTN